MASPIPMCSVGTYCVPGSAHRETHKTQAVLTWPQGHVNDCVARQVARRGAMGVGWRPAAGAGGVLVHSDGHDAA